MASFQDHINQAQRNFNFLSGINETQQDCMDWQVTVAFYTALHIVNAYLSEYDLHPEDHAEIFYQLDKSNDDARYAIDRKIYYKYRNLFNLSHRARYLSSRQNRDQSNTLSCTEKHLAQSVKLLDAILLYFAEKDQEYGDFNFNSIPFNCNKLKREMEGRLIYFDLI